MCPRAGGASASGPLPVDFSERLSVGVGRGGADEGEYWLWLMLFRGGTVGAGCPVALMDVVAPLWWDPGSFVGEVAAVSALCAEVSLVHRLSGPLGVVHLNRIILYGN